MAASSVPVLMNVVLQRRAPHAAVLYFSFERLMFFDVVSNTTLPLAMKVSTLEKPSDSRDGKNPSCGVAAADVMARRNAIFWHIEFDTLRKPPYAGIEPPRPQLD